VRVAILGSGSKGNCLVVEAGGTVVLVDVGFGPREVRRRMQHLDLDLNDIDAIVITHAHGDHVKGARQLAGSLNVPTFATEATRRFASTFTAFKGHVPVVPGERFTVGALTFAPTKTCHDEPGSVCYAIDDGDEAFGICTDLGLVDDTVAAGLRGVDTLMLEFNHDRHMLQTGPYPTHLKRRVGSKYGHLNNDDAGRLLGMAVTPSLSRLLCAHLSEVNNTPDKALSAARAVVDGRDVDVAVAPQHAPTGWLRARYRAGVPATRAAPRVDQARENHARVDRDRVVDAVLTSTPAPTTTSAPAATTTVAAPRPVQIPLRDVVRERQMRLFGPASAAATATATTTATTTARPSKERR
jgi:phosphoribosyl 1,2-cyclic phosphodiesterase